MVMAAARVGADFRNGSSSTDSRCPRMVRLYPEQLPEWCSAAIRRCVPTTDVRQHHWRSNDGRLPYASNSARHSPRTATVFVPARPVVGEGWPL